MYLLSLYLVLSELAITLVPMSKMDLDLAELDERSRSAKNVGGFKRCWRGSIVEIKRSKKVNRKWDSYVMDSCDGQLSKLFSCCEINW